MSLATVPQQDNWRGASDKFIDKRLAGLQSVFKSTGLGDNLGSTVLLKPKQSGLYRITAYLVVTTRDTTSSTLPKATVGWTDVDNNTAQTEDVTATSTGDALTTHKVGSVVIDAKAGVNITLVTASYASNTPNKMKYSIVATVEVL